ncbi:threonine/serine exporter family protein [Corticicoccus populi]|uniref:Threonine/serine exporter family protein n=1 Tax=Corticicoccus populi TaxID=1812821 RepID=A0ABW5WVA4_9STAP
MTTSELEVLETPDESLKEGYVRDVFYLAVNCGKMMLESGAETYRIEDTMMRISKKYGITDPQVFVTPTVIIFSMNEYSLTQTVRIDYRGNHLEKVENINTLSRKIAGGMPLKKALDEVETIHDTLVFPFWLMVAAGGLVGLLFLLLFNGHLSDLPAAVIGGAAGVFVMEGLLRYTRVKFFTEFFAALVISIVSYIYVSLGFGVNLDTIIISSVMPLVPGVLITNAVREMIRGHLLAGTMKGAEAALTSAAIGAGVGLVFMVI